MSNIIRDSLDIVNFYRLNEEVLYETVEEPIVETESMNKKVVDYNLLMSELESLKFKMESAQLQHEEQSEDYYNGYNMALNIVAPEMVENLIQKLRNTGE